MPPFTASRAYIEDCLDEILPNVSKPGRYTGGELNSVVKDHARAEVKYIIAFPDAYEIGMSNLACQIIYDLLNRRQDCVAERVYAPWPDMEQAMRAHHVPLFTLETRTPCADFDLWGFALSYELSYTNVLNMLDLAGVPVRWRDRDHGRPDGRPWPLIFAGGHCTFNPEPMAPFIDFFVIGEAEEVLVDITETFKAHRHRSREELLLKIAQIDGCYVPRFYEPVYETEEQRRARLHAAGIPEEMAEARNDTMPHLIRTRPLRPDVPEKIRRRVVWDVDRLDYPTKPIIPYIEVVHDRISLEVMRGCTRGCRFCQAGMITRPVREKSPERLMQLAEELVRNTGHEDISLVSLSTADYSRVDEVVHRLIEKYGGSKVGVSLPSLRADRDCVKLVQEINKVRKTGLTFAPEAGSQRMRDVTNKGVTEEDLFAACETAFSNGWQKIKLYFMISLPTETDEDVLAIGELARKCAQIARKNGVRNPTITIGVSAFVPKPFTPFQWHGQDTIEEIDRKQTLLKRSIRDRAVSYRPNEPTGTALEAILSLGDRRIADGIERAWRRGQIFTAWDEYLNYRVWQEAFAETGVDTRFFANRHKSYEEPLPWDHIDCGVTKAFLRAEDKKARAGRFTPDCHTNPCSFCQACDRAYLESAKGRQRIEELAREGKTLVLTRADRERLGIQI
ncbi:MAG: TIGR03960 family B12-binding radical SAM protein [Chloroherpetonaceae bacterium]|nr:TIGR03960 family B12-binding radical SAM protein [Chthonomonadaceae bacterium]MDW8206854.1 TIGR03960 family B12-binding radical SAM protein [Chloroherpetonaceae bacterium]